MGIEKYAVCKKKNIYIIASLFRTTLTDFVGKIQ